MTVSGSLREVVETLVTVPTTAAAVVGGERR